MATLRAYTPIKSIEGVSSLFRFISHFWDLGEVGMMEFIVAMVERTTRRKECGDTGFTTKLAHSTLTALSHFRFNIHSRLILTSKLFLFLYSLNTNPAIDGP
jgi:hypothetical protein